MAEPAAGLRGIVADALDALTDHAVPAVAGQAEGVHGMRVAVRRLRAALVLFEPLLNPAAAAGFEAELKRLGTVLGEARDWDVFCLETLPALRRDGAAAAGLDAAAALRREAAHRQLRDALAGPELTGLTLRLSAWLDDGFGPAVELPRQAAALLDRAKRVVLRRGRRIGHRSEEELHRLRKAVKKLRYGVEFLGSPDPARDERRFLKRCRTLQEQLGALNDAAVAQVLAERLGRERPDLAAEVQAVRRWSRKRARRAGQGVPQSWHHFKRARAFWS